MNNIPWQLRIFEKSLKKKEKLKLLDEIISFDQNRKALDLGCAKGTLSWFLRKKGGMWLHADLDMQNLLNAVQLLQDNVLMVGKGPLPFADDSFDLIVSLDFLEHIHNDQECLLDLYRILKPGGRFILSTPLAGKWFLINRVKKRIGLTPDLYGHVIEGYELEKLEALVDKTGFRIQNADTYSRFFTEFIETAINFTFMKILRKNKNIREARDGHISPGSAAELKKHEKSFKLYSMIYPFTYSITRLDKLIRFLKGYACLITAVKPLKSD